MAHNRYVARKILEAVREFYRDPENERRYREWKSSKSEGGASTPASTKRAPSRSTCGPSPS